MKLYHEVCENVPKPFKTLMSPLTEAILYYLHPGLSTITWSSLNIDAYLHQVCHLQLFHGRHLSRMENKGRMFYQLLLLLILLFSLLLLILPAITTITIQIASYILLCIMN